MRRAGLRTVRRYSIEFKLSSVHLTQQPGSRRTRSRALLNQEHNLLGSCTRRERALRQCVAISSGMVRCVPAG